MFYTALVVVAGGADSGEQAARAQVSILAC
jgi:hypothetical protein